MLVVWDVSLNKARNYRVFEEVGVTLAINYSYNNNYN